MHRLTESAFARCAGFAVPLIMLLSLWAGAIVDRVDKRKLTLTQTLSLFRLRCSRCS
jgi:hypothetical protein